METGPRDTLKRLMAQESASLEQLAIELSREVSRPADLLTAVSAYVNRRQRYFAMAGEHGSAFDLDGIGFVDTMDERLLTSLNRVLSARPAGEVAAEAASRVEKILEAIPSLPPHPVAYMVIYVVSRELAAFQEETNALMPDDLLPLEEAMVGHIRERVHEYVRERETPVVRHLGDVTREYAVVARLACPCGRTGLLVERQALHTMPDGSHQDCLSIKCPKCGTRRDISFPLPHFADLSGMGLPDAQE